VVLGHEATEVGIVSLDAEVQRLIDAALVSRDHDIAVALQRIEGLRQVVVTADQVLRDEIATAARRIKTLTTRADLTADRLDEIESAVFDGVEVTVVTDANQSPVLPWEPSPPRVAGQAGPAGDSAQPAGPTTTEGP
jgi:hypothetical protein